MWSNEREYSVSGEHTRFDGDLKVVRFPRLGIDLRARLVTIHIKHIAARCNPSAEDIAVDDVDQVRAVHAHCGFQTEAHHFLRPINDQFDGFCGWQVAGRRGNDSQPSRKGRFGSASTERKTERSGENELQGCIHAPWVQETLGRGKTIQRMALVRTGARVWLTATIRPPPCEARCSARSPARKKLDEVGLGRDDGFDWLLEDVLAWDEGRQPSGVTPAAQQRAHGSPRQGGERDTALLASQSGDDHRNVLSACVAAMFSCVLNQDDIGSSGE